MRVVAALALLFSFTVNAETLRVGSKRFTESYILGEVLIQTVKRAGASAEHKPGLGNTGIVFSALKAGSIDLYPEYTGTIAKEILKLEGAPGIDELNRALAPMGFGVAVPLGFSNSYALAMVDERAQALGIRTLSDLGKHRDLKLGLSQEFIGRADGWPGLKAAYGWPFPTPSGLDHGLAYEAIASGKIDVMDIYTTDAKIERFRLRTLEDDRKFFPRYDAVLLHRLDVPEALSRSLARAGETGKEHRRAQDDPHERRGGAGEEDVCRGRSDAAYGRCTAHGQQEGFSLDAVCRRFLAPYCAAPAAGVRLARGEHRARRAARHRRGKAARSRATDSRHGRRDPDDPLARAVRVPHCAARNHRHRRPRVIALFLYALLPIVRNTHAGLEAVGRGMRQAALALGLRPRERLRLIEVPLALPSILAGIKTSAVINVGTATIAAFIGAGGYGERIASGLALNDNDDAAGRRDSCGGAGADRAGRVRAWRAAVRLDGAGAGAVVIRHRFSEFMLQCG